MLHVRRVSKYSEGNPSLRGCSVELCLRERLLGAYSKSHNILYRLGTERFMSI